MRWKRFHIEDKETIVTLLCQPAYRMSAVYAMKQFRSRLEEVIRQNPEFRTSHIPLEVSQDGDEFIQSMLTASSMVRVGPMAGVAGAFAEVALEGLLHTGAPEAVVDNGGDIALSVLSPVTIGIYTGNAAVQNLGFKIQVTREPLGICTSSGTVGHSFSYGKADAAVVISRNIILADAAATALGNRVHQKEDLENCFDFLEDIREIQGALVVYQDQVAMWGALPELTEVRMDENIITRGLSERRR